MEALAQHRGGWILREDWQPLTGLALLTAWLARRLPNVAP
jgi:hypothetical protein